jgi:hypothetical protein
MKFIDELEKKFKLLKEAEECDDQEVDEASTSANAGPYNTPNAFSASGKEDEKGNAEVLGYKKVPKKKKDGTVYASPEPNITAESDFKRISKELYLGEVSYSQFKTSNPKIKVNAALHEISRKLNELEKVISHAVRLKTESGMESDQYWKSSHIRLGKIYETLLSVAKQFKALKG